MLIMLTELFGIKVSVKYVRPNNSRGKVRSNCFPPATSFYKLFNSKLSLLAICILTILLVTGYTENAYNGNIYIFLLFSAASNFLLLFVRGRLSFPMRLSAYFCGLLSTQYILEAVGPRRWKRYY
jgi:hypothetical protein